MYMRYKNFFLFFVTAFFFFFVFGQQTKAIISGTIKDAKTKSPITEAVITLSSDAFKGQKFAVTDSSGVYKINNLPAGKYTIIFEMECYQKFIRDSITLKEGMSVGINYEMVRERRAS